jgi:hypothetical protein
LEAITTFGFHWFIPLGILTVFGSIWLFKVKENVVAMWGTIAVGFAMDFAIAYMIYDAHQTFLKLLGESTIEFYRDINFYIVLILGFGSQLSLTFLLSEYVDMVNSDTIRKKARREKELISENLENVLIPALNEAKKELEIRKGDLEFKKDVLVKLESVQPTEFLIDGNQIAYLINTYYNGWLLAFANLRMPQDEKENQRVRFEEIKINAINQISNAA